MTKKDLESIFFLKQLILIKKSQLRELEEESRSIKAIDYSKEKIKSSNLDSSIEINAVKMVETQETITKLEYKFTKKKIKAENEILNLENKDERDILLLKYLQYKSYDNICKIIKKSKKNIIRIHNEGLKHLNNM